MLLLLVGALEGRHPDGTSLDFNPSHRQRLVVRIERIQEIIVFRVIIGRRCRRSRRVMVLARIVIMSDVQPMTPLFQILVHVRL